MSTKFYIKDENGIYLSTDGMTKYTCLEGKALYDFLKSEEGKSRSFHVDIDENGDKIGIEAEPKMITACSEQRERDRYRAKVKAKLNITIVSANTTVSIPGEDDIELIETIVDEETDVEAEAMHNLDLETLRKALHTLTREEYRIIYHGRDEGLTEIDPDSAKAFERWYESDRFGGHPWEIYPGGNYTHIDLAVSRDKRGFYFSIAGKSESRCIEAIRIYLALKRSDLPVFLRDAKRLVKRLLETELIGIVPQGIIPRYCESMFPGEEVIDFMNLPYEEDEVKKMLPFIKWQPLEEFHLV